MPGGPSIASSGNSSQKPRQLPAEATNHRNRPVRDRTAIPPARYGSAGRTSPNRGPPTRCRRPSSGGRHPCCLPRHSVVFSVSSRRSAAHCQRISPGHSLQSMIASSGHSDNECLALRGRLNMVTPHFESWPDEIGWSIPLSYSRFRYRGDSCASASSAARRRPAATENTAGSGVLPCD